MNSTIDLLQAHHCDRHFTQEKIDENILNNIIKAAHQAPTSLNSQQISLVVTQNASHREKIAEISGGQPWIAQAPVFITVILDLKKTAIALELAGTKQHHQNTIESIVAGCTDVGIVLSTLMVAARSYGLGVVPIGAIRANTDEMIKLLKLPKYTFPMVGICIGHVKQSGQHKPRLALDSFCHYEHYEETNIKQAINDYHAPLTDYLAKMGLDKQYWENNLSKYYQSCYFPELRVSLQKQGFNFE